MKGLRRPQTGRPRVSLGIMVGTLTVLAGLLTVSFAGAQTPETGTVIVKKLMMGGVDSFEFSGTPSGTISTDGGTISAQVPPGEYVSTEAVKEGWTLLSVGCNDDNSGGNRRDRHAIFRVEAGETVTCQFRNKKNATLIVEKVMVGGQATFTFTGMPAGSISASGGTITAAVEGGSTYTSTEAPMDGWELVSIVCDDSNSSGDVGTRTASFQPSPGEVIRCVFTNRKIDPERGSITVRKVTNPANDPQQFDFQFGQTPFSLGDGGSRTFGDLDAGTYSASESTPAGWTLTSATCDNGDSPSEIGLDEGEDVTCTFTNTKNPPETGSITIRKVTNPAGDPQQFDFQFGQTAFSLGDGGSRTFGDLDAGTYSASESTPEDWTLTSATCDNGDSPSEIGLDEGEDVTCTFFNTKRTPPPPGSGSIDVQKSASPTVLKEPGGNVTYSVRITNTSNVNVTVTNVVDDKFGDLDDSGGNGCFDVPINLAPGESASCQFTRAITGPGGYVHTNTVCADATDPPGNRLRDCDNATVTITPRVIDLVIVKEATSPTPLNGTVDYSLTVTNKGPDTATNVVMSDPAPAGIQYQSATPSQGTCVVTVSLVTCQLGTLTAGQTVTIAIKGKAIAVGTWVNTATVTGGGGAEANPADNTDSAETVVPAPVTPPVNPTPPKKPDKCAYLVVTPKMIKADGKRDRVVATVRSTKGPMKGVRVIVRYGGASKSARTNGKGVAVVYVNPMKPGVITITAVNQGDPCGARRVGVSGVFLPPVTG